MSDRDTITLPREVVEKAVKAFENGCPPTCEKGMIDSGGFHPWGEPALVPCPACLAFEHLRTALAAEQPKPKPEPVAVFDEQMGHPVLLLGSPMLKDKQPLYTAPPDAEALRRDAERLREAIEAYIRAKDSDGGGKGGFFPKPPTVAHQRRVHLAWQELNAALRREET